MDNHKDLEYSVSRNFQFKNNFSKNSLEHIAYHNLISGESTVANRHRRQEWIQSVLIDCKDSIADILDMKRTGRNTEGQELSQHAQAIEIEQLKLKVLHELGWKYNGSFLRGAEETYTDAHGNIHEKGDSYPELSFFLTSRKEGDSYWYAASYGIMRSSESSDFGSYSYFATLDEALEFINDELLIVGRNALFKKIMQEAVRAQIQKDNVKSVNNEIYKKYVEKLRPRVEDRINTIVSEKVIEEKFHNVRRSTDIFILPDLIEMFLIPISDSYLSVAKQDEFRAKKAQEITDTVAVDLDDDDSDIPEAESLDVELKSPEETLKDIEYDSIRKNQAENIQALEDKTHAQDFEPSKHSQGENLFSSASSAVPLVPVSDREELSNKPSYSPRVKEKESTGLFTSRKKTEDEKALTSAKKEENTYKEAPRKEDKGRNPHLEEKNDSLTVSPGRKEPGKASVSLSEDLKDTFKSDGPKKDSIASVSILGGDLDVKDSFDEAPSVEKAQLDNDVDLPDSFKSGWEEKTISITGDLEELPHFDDIEIDVAQETWDSIDSALGDFFDADRLPVKTEDSELAEDIDSFL